ncbi:MAG: hypothetical protein HY094_05595 [Candidatus Melainabacteria bacterium]|nr:hypothetical protein [Candidatus Melainabacteria bacterium]
MQILPANLPLSYHRAIEPYFDNNLLNLLKRASRDEINIMKRRLNFGGKKAEVEFIFKGKNLDDVRSPIPIPRLVRDKLIGSIVDSGWRSFLDGTSGNVSLFSNHVRLHGNNNLAINSTNIKTTGDNSKFINSHDIEAPKSSNSIFCDSGGEEVNGRLVKTSVIACPASLVFQTRILKAVNSPHLRASDCESVHSIRGGNNVLEHVQGSVLEGCTNTTLDHCESVKATNCKKVVIKNTNGNALLDTFSGLKKVTVENGETLTRWVRFMRLFGSKTTNCSNPKPPEQTP